jgi:hypothetical protein
MATHRAPRKCSLCREEGCNKSKPTCPIRMIMATNSCPQCHREGCDVNNPNCPVKREIQNHHLIANAGFPMRFLGRVSNYAKIINPNLFDHVTEATLKRIYLRDLLEKITSIYSQKIVEAINNSRVSSPVQVPAQVPAPAPVPAPVQVPAPVIPQKVKLLSGYKTCTEECGVCYDKMCDLTFNCDHQLCFDCFKGIIRSKNPALKCPFCRGYIENVQAGNHQTLVNLVALK